MQDKFNQAGNELAVTIAMVIALLISLVIIFLVMIVYYNNRKKKMIHEKKEMQSAFTQTLLQTRLEIQEETFKTISQEIHDNIGQSLSFVKLNLNTIDDTSPATKEKITESKNLLTKTIHDLRDIARSLNPDFISELGLYGAIEQQLQLLQKTGEYKTAFMVTGDTYKTDQQRELVVFRIVQELLNNTVKHAAANEVSITMDYQANQLIITVHDNGKGFDIDAMQSVQNNNGLGLRNMLSRMILIKGFITINSKPMEGTTAVIELPKQLNP